MNTVFTERLKLIRTEHGLSLGELSRYCTIFNKISINRSTLGYWESSQRTPTVDSLRFVSDIFGISLDWLLGRSNNKYDKSTLELLEYKTFPITVNVCNTIVELPILIPDDYIDFEQRIEKYNLEARANIIFLLYVIKYEWERYVGDNIKEFSGKDTSEIKLVAFQLFHYFMVNKSKRSKLEEYINSLNTIFVTKTAAYTINEKIK